MPPIRHSSAYCLPTVALAGRDLTGSEHQVRPMGRSKMLPKQPSVAAAVTPSAGDVAGD